MTLPGCELTAADYERLSHCGISADLARQAMLRRVDSSTGGSIVGRNGRSDYSGILFPYQWPGEPHIREYRLRRDKPDYEYKNGERCETGKYLSPPGRGNMLYFVPGMETDWLTDTALPVIVTEGEKKCLALWHLARQGRDTAHRPRWLPVGLSGVWNWRGTIGKEPGPDGSRRDVKGPIVDLERISWTGRSVVIVFDVNIATNQSVEAARRALTRELQSRGAVVHHVDLPEVEGINGVDDLLGKWGPERTLAVIEQAKPADDSVRYLWNDAGNADRLVDIHGGDLRFCPERNAFMVWGGTRWSVDSNQILVERLAELVIRRAFSEAGTITDDEKRKAFVRFVNNSLQRKGITNMVHSARRKVRNAAITDFDANPDLLNFTNGTLDLRTGELRPHQHEDLITKLIPYPFDSEAKCPTFDSFVHRAMGGKADATEEEATRTGRLMLYLKRAVGCAAVGKPSKALFVLHGEGDNGKTTFVEVIRDALGADQYAGEIKVETLMASAREATTSNAIGADLASLRGCRFVSSSEVEQGQKLSLARVKYLTGTGQIRARYLHENHFNFAPSHTLFLDCNHRPVINDSTDAVWNRLKLIPFTVQIPKAEIDVNLPEKLRSELPGIMAWIAEGAREYLAEGLPEIPEVQAATEDYRQESDRLKDFIDECCILDGEAWVKKTDLFQAYMKWKDEIGEAFPTSKKWFEDRLAKMGLRAAQDPSGQHRAWRGIALKEFRQSDSSDNKT